MSYGISKTYIINFYNDIADKQPVCFISERLKAIHGSCGTREGPRLSAWTSTVNITDACRRT